MLSSAPIEDIFSKFYLLVVSGKVPVQPQDYSPIVSFYTRIDEGTLLTKNQADYILRILDKYKNLSAGAGLDYKESLIDPLWKNSFRVLDLAKRIYVEKAADGKIEVCLKFPFQLKKEFDDEISIMSTTHRANKWDPEDKIRRLDLYEYNLMALYDFANKHNFDIDDSFMSVLADVEEIWQHSEEIVPSCKIDGVGVYLTNATEDANTYYQENKTENVPTNLLLAKSMGYLLSASPRDTVEKIAASPENTFWIKDYSTFFSIYNQLKDRVCIILDRTSDTLGWLQNFVAEADKMMVSRDEIKVCFRDGKDSKSGINDWIKLAGVGGKVETGKILIFESKPAKWLFKDNQDVKLLVTNNIYPPTNGMAREWFHSHPCVIYLGDVKPTAQKGQKIVEL